MEFLVLVGALVPLDVLAVKFGHDSRDNDVMDRHQRALDAVRAGDHALYYTELQAFEEGLQKRRLL